MDEIDLALCPPLTQSRQARLALSRSAAGNEKDSTCCSCTAAESRPETPTGRAILVSHPTASYPGQPYRVRQSQRLRLAASRADEVVWAVGDRSNAYCGGVLFAGRTRRSMSVSCVAAVSCSQHRRRVAVLRWRVIAANSRCGQ